MNTQDNKLTGNPQKEQFRVHLFRDGKLRNRAEAHLVEFAKQLVAEPLALTIEQVKVELEQEQARTERLHPSWGKCSVHGPHTTCRMGDNHNHVMRAVYILGRGRKLSTLSICETVMKDAANGYAPLLA